VQLVVEKMEASMARLVLQKTTKVKTAEQQIANESARVVSFLSEQRKFEDGFNAFLKMW
jgi:hypothetical protein